MTDAVVHTIELRVRVVLELVPLVVQPAAASAPAEPVGERSAAPPGGPPRPRARKGGGSHGGVGLAAPPAQRERALDAYDRGATFAEAGRVAGVTGVAVSKWVRASGREVRPGAWKKPAAAAQEDGEAEPPPAPAPPAPAPPAPAPPAPPALGPAPSSVSVARPPSAPPALAARPGDADARAIAAAVAAGRVTRVPDPGVFAALPAIVDTVQARTVLQSAGAVVRRRGVSWEVDGRKVDNVGLMQAAQAAQRRALLQDAAAAQ